MNNGFASGGGGGGGGGFDNQPIGGAKKKPQNFTVPSNLLENINLNFFYYYFLKMKTALDLIYKNVQIVVVILRLIE
jgi:hypothetical protein